MKWILSGNWRSLDAKLDLILQAITALSGQERQMNADLQARFDDLSAKVTAGTTVERSAVVLLNGLSAEIAALKNTTTDPAVLAAIDALAAGVSSQTADLAASVVANTKA